MASDLADARTALQLFNTHRAALVSYASAITGSPAQAEDVVQEAWVKLGRAGDPELLRHPVNYLFRIVRNLAIDARRALVREHRRSEGPLDAVAAALADDQPSPEAVALARNEMQIVLDALAELPERTQIAVRMNRIEGRKLREVAQHLGISVTRAHALIAEAVAHCDRRRSQKISGPSGRAG